MREVVELDSGRTGRGASTRREEVEEYRCSIGAPPPGEGSSRSKSIEPLAPMGPSLLALERERVRPNEAKLSRLMLR